MTATAEPETVTHTVRYNNGRWWRDTHFPSIHITLGNTTYTGFTKGMTLRELITPRGHENHTNRAVLGALTGCPLCAVIAQERRISQIQAAVQAVNGHA